MQSLIPFGIFDIEIFFLDDSLAHGFLISISFQIFSGIFSISIYNF